MVYILQNSDKGMNDLQSYGVHSQFKKRLVVCLYGKDSLSRDLGGSFLRVTVAVVWFECYAVFCHG